MNKDQKKFHALKRKEFARLIGKDSIAIIFGNSHKTKSYDGNYKFKQHKNFYYLTGCTEADAALVIIPSGLKSGSKNKLMHEILYVQEKNELKEKWMGKTLGFENVRKELGIENGRENTKLKNLLSFQFLRKYRRVYVNLGEMLKLTGEAGKSAQTLFDILNVAAAHSEITDASFLLGTMRLRKTPFEIKMMKIAADISGKSYSETLKEIRAGSNEFSIQTLIECSYRNFGSEEPAYPSIVASGENACVMHYEKNNKPLKDKELLLIDSGAEYEYYCSDITRTFPINRKFTKEQREIYEIVLRANKETIRRAKSGVRFSALNKISKNILAEGLIKLGLMKDKKAIDKYSPHGLGHHIGLDTHDAVPSGKFQTDDYDVLRSGNVITIEPGLYFTSDMKEIPAKYRGIGIRIEDDILITKNGNENLTSKVAKDISDIEKLML